MKRFLFQASLFMFFCVGLLSISQVNGQIKIGNHPTQIHPFSILELESNNQAIRLTQGDTAAINAIIDTEGDREAAEGLLMFYNYSENGTIGAGDTGIYIRKKGHWEMLLSKKDIGNQFWTLGGNEIADSSAAYLGSNSNKTPLTLGVNNKGLIILHSRGNVEILADSSYFNHRVTMNDSLSVLGGREDIDTAFKVTDSVYINTGLAIHDSIVIKRLGNAMPGDKEVLVLGSNGTIRKMNIDSLDITTVEGNENMTTNLVTDDYDMADEEKALFSTLICNVETAGKSITIKLPDPADIDGRTYTIKKIGKADDNQLEKSVTIDATNGNAHFTSNTGPQSTKIYNNWTSLKLQAQGGIWYIIGH